MAGSLQATNVVRASVAHSKTLLRCFLAVIASPLSELRTALGQSNTDEEVTFMSQVKLHLGSHIPLFISLAAGENILVVASRSMITTWDVTAVLNGQVRRTPTIYLIPLIAF